ncbi:hypothetical protein MRB53_019283 [Persea americana]|uniref:Uncharacterized protein n=1 Tax=Persea americana TaxID=3435 RepID=A0ACC2KXI0_PERAE|nr:hypothetical protein MRB53_019283 [Persea americana]
MLGWVATVEADTVSEGKLGAVEVEKVEDDFTVVRYGTQTPLLRLQYQLEEAGNNRLRHQNRGGDASVLYDSIVLTH